ncbi:hypothetical protein SOV_07490 [Sporomusa ovata DSM 2662]|uniref:IS66 family insertion sequence element accessory protein TnpA n=1 Tax=Sporomusa ovata TaxID=2378 RepID=UPI0003888B22|nr:hypothetical protein [Sporomusa ovata]EQB28403.1 hypothetical protein SOV_1c00870 [Sporomusa ovata DSM 2662]
MDTREVTRQYRLSKWIEIVGECRSSGKKISAWCAENNINPKQYYYWLKRVRTAACESLQVIGTGDQTIVPIKMPDHLTQTSHTSQSPAILRMGTVTLELNNSASTELIANAIKALTNVR